MSTATEQQDRGLIAILVDWKQSLEAEAEHLATMAARWNSKHDCSVASLAASPANAELGNEIIFLASTREHVNRLQTQVNSELHRVGLDLQNTRTDAARLRQGKDSVAAWRQRLEEKKDQLAAAKVQLDAAKREQDECQATIQGWEARIRQIDESSQSLREQVQELESRRAAIEIAMADQSTDNRALLKAALKQSLELNRSETSEIRKKASELETERRSLETIVLRERSRLDPKQKGKYNLKNLAEPLEILRGRIAELQREHGALEAKVTAGEMRLQELDGKWLVRLVQKP